MQRIALRDRTYERTMERGYIDQLNQAYDSFFVSEGKHPWPVLVIESNGLDYVRSSDDLHWVENNIRQRLQMGPFQPELPMDKQTT